MSSIQTVTSAKQSPMETKLTIFKNRNFLYLFIGALFSAPGYYVYLMGAEWLMLTITDNRFYFGMLFFAASIPRLLFLTTGGIVADRYNKRTVLLLSDISRAILVLILIILVWNDAVVVWNLIVLAALFGISDAFSYPSLNSLTPTIVQEKQLQRGNSLIQMTSQISPILGPALGGGLIVWIGFKGVFTVACVMLIIASLSVLQIKLSSTTVGESNQLNFLTEFKQGFSYAKSNQLLVSIMIIALFLNFFLSGPMTIGIPILVKDIFEENALGLTVMEVSLGGGALLGAIFMSIVGNFKKPGFILVISLMLLGLMYMMTGFAVHLFINAALLAIIGFVIQLINIPIMTMIQKSSDERMLGRMMSLLMTVSTGLVPISFVVTSLLIAVGIDIRYIILVGGLLVAIVAILNLRNKRIINYHL